MQNIKGRIVVLLEKLEILILGHNFLLLWLALS